MTTEDEHTILLTHTQYAHIIDKNTGTIRLEVGPARVQLDSNEHVHGIIREKIVLRSNQYCVILNPVVDGKLRDGERELRKGPLIFCMYPSEKIERGIRPAYVLAKNEGMYIRDIQSGAVRLETGPKQIFLGANEELYQKQLTDTERRALRLDAGRPAYKAIAVELLENEVIQLYDRNHTRVELGPKRIFLGPFERPKVVKLSGETPKRPGVLVKAKLTLGSDFISDILRVRTRDNAVLKLTVQYKQRFEVDPENLGRIFLINDFIGFVTETLASEIREEAAQHDFEVFHAKAYDIIKDLLFPKKDDVRQWRTFENGLEIFGVDIKQIAPEDPEIANKLNTAISNNMDIFVRKLLQAAELEARRELIAGEKAIEKMRQALIELKSSNARREKLERARIDAQAAIVSAKGAAEARTVEQEILIAAEKQRVEELKRVLSQPSADPYLRLLELQALGSVRKSYVMTGETAIRLPFSSGAQTDE